MSAFSRDSDQLALTYIYGMLSQYEPRFSTLAY